MHVPLEMTVLVTLGSWQNAVAPTVAGGLKDPMIGRSAALAPSTDLEPSFFKEPLLAPGTSPNGVQPLAWSGVPSASPSSSSSKLELRTRFSDCPASSLTTAEQPLLEALQVWAFLFRKRAGSSCQSSPSGLAPVSDEQDRWSFSTSQVRLVTQAQVALLQG